jgi:hypothetical protein
MLPNSVYILLKLNYHVFYAVEDSSHFYYWYFVRSWNQV